MRKLWLCLVLAACVQTDRSSGPVDAVPSVGVAGPVLPDIFLILTDDMRADQLATMPNVRTRLADSGVTYSKMFANTALCCPSRASLLTGLYQSNHGVRGNGAPWGGATVFHDASTLVTDLRAAGYRTALFGKYLNQYDLLPDKYLPPGWDEWRVYQKTHYAGAYLVEKAFDSSVVTVNLYTGATPTVLRSKIGAYLTRVPTTQPLFLEFASFTPHYEVVPYGYPWIATSDLGVCASIPAPAHTAAFNEVDVSDKPAYVQAAPLLTASQRLRADTAWRKQCEALRVVDREVADILLAQQSRGRIGQTVILFSSDNGYHFGEHRLFERKATMYEEAIHLPLVIRGPGFRSGVVDTNLVQMVDVNATIRAIAGLGPIGDGRSLVPNLQSGLFTTDAVLLEQDNPSLPSETFLGGLRTHQWAYAEYPAGGPNGTPFVELYDLANDPFETVNRAYDPAFSSVVTTLAARMRQLRGF